MTITVSGQIMAQTTTKQNQQAWCVFVFPSFVICYRNKKNSNNNTDVLDEVHCTVLVICVTCIQMTIGSSHATVLPVPRIVHEFDLDPASSVDKRRFHVAVTQLFMCSIGGKRTCSMEHCHDYDSCIVGMLTLHSLTVVFCHGRIPSIPCVARI